MILYSIYSVLIRPLRRNRLVHRILFGYTPISLDSGDVESWDWSTICIRSALRKIPFKMKRFLDLGTGAFGSIAIFAAKILHVPEVWGIDNIPDVLVGAKTNSVSAKTSIMFVCCDLFSGVRGTFDTISFNAPYLDIHKGKILGILRSERDIQRFSGGRGGGEVIERFLTKAPDVLRPDGVLLLGVNHHHITRENLSLLVRRSVFVIADMVEHRLTRSVTYVLRMPDSR